MSAIPGDRLSKGYCVWRPQIGEAFEKAIRKSVGESLLAEKIIELFSRLWRNRTKSSRASLALVVFPDLTSSELEEMTMVDAYVLPILSDITELNLNFNNVNVILLLNVLEHLDKPIVF